MPVIVDVGKKKESLYQYWVKIMRLMMGHMLEIISM